MRTSSLRSPVAVIRTTIGLSTFDFAGLLNVSVSTIEKLESGRLNLSEEVQDRLLFETGVDEEWLNFGLLLQRPVVAEGGTPFTKEAFERRRVSMALKKLEKCGCGGQASIGTSTTTARKETVSGYMVYCTKCSHTNLVVFEPFKTPEDARRHWNGGSNLRRAAKRHS